MTVVKASTPRFSLLDLERELVLLTDELLGYSERAEEPPTELLEAIAGGITATAEKRDRVANFLRFVRRQPDLIDDEISRLKLRKQSIEKGIEHLEKYVMHVMESTDQVVMEGLTSTFKRAKNPSHVVAPDTSVLPDEYVKLAISFTVTRAEYQDIRAELDDMVDEVKIKSEPDKAQLKKVLQAGNLVTGATLKQDERLEIK